MTTLTALGFRLLGLLAWVQYAAASGLAGLLARSQPDKVHFAAEPAAQPVLLLALYQSGSLRPDIVNTLQAAGRAGFARMVVNTGRLDDPESLRPLAETYIERVNYGRDFGSYKAGILRLIASGAAGRISRLVLLNDSMFHASGGMDTFLAALCEGDDDLLAATETYTVQHHYGSFALSFGPRLLSDARFVGYWRRYKNSDMRPKVIWRGEKGLTRAIRAALGQRARTRALYDTEAYRSFLAKDPANLDIALANLRSNAPLRLKTMGPGDVLTGFAERHAMQRGDVSPPVLQMADMPVPDTARDALRDHIVATLCDHFATGSQIHQNALILRHMGLPLIKLDGVYRGFFTTWDVERLCDTLTPSEAKALRALMLGPRRFGATTLTGMRKAAFLRGLI